MDELLHGLTSVKKCRETCIDLEYEGRDDVVELGYDTTKQRDKVFNALSEHLVRKINIMYSLNR